MSKTYDNYGIKKVHIFSLFFPVRLLIACLCLPLSFLSCQEKVDPVKIESLEKFGTPNEVGARVMRVEQGKDGTLDTKLLAATAEKQGDLALYTLVSANGVEALVQLASLQ